MNQPNQPSEPLIASAQPGAIEDNMMEGTPNQIEIDKDFSEKIINAVENTPEGEGNPEGNSTDVAAPESNNEAYEPAKEFTDFLNKEIAADDHRVPSEQNRGREASAEKADLSVLRELLVDNPHMAPAVKEALSKQGINLDDGDPATMQRLEGMQNTINELATMIRSDRDTIHGNQVFENVNDLYLDVVKDVPDHQRTLTDFFNNALMRDHDLNNIDREMLEGSNKAVTAELDNYFEARVKSEGYSKSTGVPPSRNTNLGELTPPPASEKKDYGDPRNRPMNAFAEVDADFSRKVNNLFTQ